MSGDYFDVGQFRERNGKWRFQKLGSAKENDKGGWDIYLDALPLQDNPNSCRMTIVPQRENAGRQFEGPSAPRTAGPRRDQPGTGAPFKDDDFDSIPF